MKKIAYLFILVVSINCQKKGCTDKNALNFSSKHTKDNGSCLYMQAEKSDQDAIPFEGIWTREFEAGTGSGFWHTVTYNVYQDSIRYTLTGPVGNSDYTMHRDTLILEDNRYIGHTINNVHYLVFTKEITTDSIKIYKEIVPTIEIGLTLQIPDDTTTANHGWLYYSK
jgi:hypothetical protein